MAGEDYALNVPGVYVHDRQYHIVRFTHRARASTLQLDQLPVQTRKHKQLQQLADDDREYNFRYETCMLRYENGNNLPLIRY